MASRGARGRPPDGGRLAAGDGALDHLVKSAMLDNVKDAPLKARENVGGWWNNGKEFLAEVRNEMKRVTWPTRKEVYATTIVVILTSIFFGLYLWGIDLVLAAVVHWIFRAMGVA